MNRGKNKRRIARIRQQQKREKPSIDQIVNESIKGKLNHVYKIGTSLVQTKQKIILVVLISLFLFILFLQNEIFWIPFCIAGSYSIVPISEYRYSKRRLTFWKQELEESREFLKSVKAYS